MAPGILRTCRRFNPLVSQECTLHPLDIPQRIYQHQSLCASRTPLHLHPEPKYVINLGRLECISRCWIWGLSIKHVFHIWIPWVRGIHAFVDFAPYFQSALCCCGSDSGTAGIPSFQICCGCIPRSSLTSGFGETCRG